MNDDTKRRGEAREPQPWHAADEKPESTKTGGAPIGTHSLTGGSVNVGIPDSPKAAGTVERSHPRDMPPGAHEPGPLAEPRAGSMRQP